MSTYEEFMVILTVAPLIVAKDYSQYTRITKEEDDTQGVPFSKEVLQLLWEHKEYPFVDTVLIYCYSGWRINEHARMPIDSINLEAHTFTGGLKNRYSRNRTIPIHSVIYGMVYNRLDIRFKSLVYHDGIKDISEQRYRECFNTALRSCGIQTVHSRHTFNMLLDDARIDRVTRYKLMGHKGQDINENVYTHKDLNQLWEAVEAIKAEQ